MKRFEPEDLAQIATLKRGGSSIEAIVAQTGWSRATVSAHLKGVGMTEAKGRHKRAASAPEAADSPAWCEWCGDDIEPGLRFCSTKCANDFRADEAKRRRAGEL